MEGKGDRRAQQQAEIFRMLLVRACIRHLMVLEEKD